MMTEHIAYTDEHETLLYSYLMDYQSGEMIRRATVAEEIASTEASKTDGGHGIIIVDGRNCFVS